MRINITLALLEILSYKNYGSLAAFFKTVHSQDAFMMSLLFLVILKETTYPKTNLTIVILANVSYVM